ncbi:hypothetical protein MMC09_000193 [Bachmanniomyces sp. S44760]|nr:hypothetical protein [Bachmanniomyces sp. S44760]
MAHINPKHHAEYVKKIGPAYSMSNVIRSEPSIDSAIELLGDRLDKLAKDGTSTNLGQWFSFVAFDILGEVTFSKRMGFLNQGIDVGNSIANTYALSFYVVLMAYAQWLHAILLGNPILRWLDFMPNEHILTTAVENVHARKNSKDVRVDMMEQWMLMQEKMAGRMDDRQVLMAAVGNIGAGGETVAAEMQAFFYIMMRHPEHFSRLRVEIDQADERGELSRVVSLAESQKLPFLQACIKETLRMFPAFSWSLPRVAPEEGLTIGDRHFTKGTVLSVHPWVINRSVECFGPDAHVFNPCRWLDPVRSQKLDRYMISFGSGPNMCLGRNLAMLELSKILPTLVRDFEFTQVDQSKEWKFHTLVIAVPYGWPCYIQRRERAKQVSGEKAQYPG